MNKKVKDIHTIDAVWKQRTEKLCGDFQKLGGEMIVVASQPQRQLYACCTSKARDPMLTHFKTFKECLQISQKLSKPSEVSKKAAERKCSLCLSICWEPEMRDCKSEDAKYVLGIEVPQYSKICADCSDSVQKFQNFKKKVTEKQNHSNIDLCEKGASTTQEKTPLPENENVFHKPIGEGVKDSESDNDSHYSDEYCSMDSNVTAEIELDEKLEEKEEDKSNSKEKTTHSSDSDIRRIRPVTRSSLKETEKQNESKQITAKKCKEVSPVSVITRSTKKKTPLILSQENKAETKKISGILNQKCAPAVTTEKPMKSNTSRTTRFNTGTPEDSKPVNTLEKQEAPSSGSGFKQQKFKPRLLSSKLTEPDSLSSLADVSNDEESSVSKNVTKKDKQFLSASEILKKVAMFINEEGSVSKKVPIKEKQFSSAPAKLKKAAVSIDEEGSLSKKVPLKETQYPVASEKLNKTRTSGTLKGTSSSVNLILVGGPDHFQHVQPLTQKGPLGKEHMHSEGTTNPPAATQQTGRTLIPSCPTNLIGISSLVPSSSSKSKSSSTVMATTSNSTSVVSTPGMQSTVSSIKQNVAENISISSGIVKFLPPQTNLSNKLLNKQSLKSGERPLVPKMNNSKGSEVGVVGERPLVPKMNNSKDSEVGVVGSSNNAKLTQTVPISTSLQTILIVGAPNLTTPAISTNNAVLMLSSSSQNLTHMISTTSSTSTVTVSTSSNSGTKPATPMTISSNFGKNPAIPIATSSNSGTKLAKPIPLSLNSGTKPAIRLLLPRLEKKDSKEKTDVVNSSGKEESKETSLSAEAGDETVLTTSTQDENKSPQKNSTLFKMGNVYYQLVVKDGKQFLVPNGQQLIIGQPDGSASQQNKIRNLETGKGVPNPKKRKLIEEELHTLHENQIMESKPSQVKKVKEELIPESDSDPEIENFEEEEERLFKHKREYKPPGKQDDSNSDKSQTSAVDHEYSVRQAEINPVDCHKCGFSAFYWKTVANHMRKHKKKRYCLKCNSFLTTRKFSSHRCKQLSFRKARKHVCLICSRMVNNAVMLFKHYRISHKSEIEKHGHCNALYRSVRSQNVFVCKGCLAVEYSELSMLNHVKKVHVCVPSERTNSISHLPQKNEPVCACPVCWIHLPEKKHLDYHLNVFHVSKENFNCHLCDEKHNSKEDLVSHYSTHEPNIKYSCGICQELIKPLSSLQEVINHRNTLHPTNSLHVLLICPVSGCNRSFDEDTEFLHHIAQHEIGQKYSYPCSKCEFTASSENIYARHVAKFHYEPERRCNICTKRFKTPSELNTHLEKHEKDMEVEIFICEHCGKINSNSSQHSKHMKHHREKMKRNTLFCEVCSEGFRAEPYLARHMFTSHPEVKHSIVPTHFPCIYCDHISMNSSSYRRHISSHKRVMPYVCSFCNKSFCDKILLNKHLTHHHQKIDKRFRCFVCHIDRDAHELRSHLHGETHKNNCHLAGINVQDYNQDLLNAIPSKSEILKRPRFLPAKISHVDKLHKVHKDHCQRAAQVIAEREVYSVMTSDGQEFQIDMQSSNSQCEECGLVFKTDADLEEHRGFVRLIDSKAHRNNFSCLACDIYLHGKLTVVEHAGTESHIELCQSKGIDPDDILEKNKIPISYRKAKRKEISIIGYRCKICDIYFRSKKSKDSHIEKANHVEKCQEQGVDPAGDHFEDYGQEKKLKKNMKTLKQKQGKKLKERNAEKVITRRKRRYVRINLLGVQVPKNVAFGCLVCGVDLSCRIQAIDHLNTSKHILNCVCRGIHSGPANMKIIMDDYHAVIGKSVAELLGIPSNTVFPLSETDKALYQKQIQEAESAKTRKKRSSKVEKANDLENTINLLEKQLFSSSALTTASPQKPSASYTHGKSVSRGETSTSNNSQNEFYQSNSVSSNVAVPVYQGAFVPPSPRSRTMVTEDQILYDDVTEVPDIAQNTALVAFGAEAANLDSFK